MRDHDEVTWSEIDHGTGLPRVIEWRGTQYDVPDLEEIEHWVYSSRCESILGATVEPDGIDPDGAPSWLIAVGLI